MAEAQEEDVVLSKTYLSQKHRVVKRGHQICEEDIIEIIYLHEQGKTVKEISNTVRRHEDTVRKYVKKYDANENPFYIKRKELESGVHTAPSRVDYLCELVMNYPCCTIEVIRKHYESCFGPISRSMIYYVLYRHLKLRWKKTRMVELARATDSMRQLRLEL